MTFGAPRRGAHAGALGEVFRFEVAYRLRQPSTWIYAVVLFGMPFGLMHAINGSSQYLNAPVMVMQASTILGSLGMLVTAGIFGDAASRDVQTRMHALFYTSPVREAQYLVADGEPVDVRSRRVDHPGDLQTEYRRQLRGEHLLGRPGADGGVDTVDPGRPHPHAYLTRARFRQVPVAHAEHLGTAELVDDYRLHLTHLLGGISLRRRYTLRI